jgi:hypothetical protein
MYRIATTAALALLLGGPPAQAQPGPQRPQAKKLIEWGWDEPDTQFMRQNVEKMEQLPFDELVFHAASGKRGNLSWEIWGGRRFEHDEFRQALDDLKATRFRRFTDRFLRVNVTPGKVDWFDGPDWATVLHNAGVAARLARQGGCKGFLLDVEQYEGKPFDYRRQGRRGTKSFEEYRRQVRRRGREWVRAVNREFPDITVLLTFGYSIAQPGSRARDRSEAPYGLLADFLDGVLDACSTETTVVDAWETSYPYKERRQFERAYETIKEKALGWTAVPGKYRKQVQAGFGIWMDYDWRKKGWDTTDFSKNHFRPAEFEGAVRSALQVSDRYVWVYTEQPRWWTGAKLPQAYVDALTNARKGVRPARGAPAEKSKGPPVKKLGTIDLLMVGRLAEQRALANYMLRTRRPEFFGELTREQVRC